MSRQSTAFILGYHGCDASIARDVVNLKNALKQSENAYDWLGSGIYFWESDPQRAWEWADEQEARKKKQSKSYSPAVIGAVIDLKNCLDLMVREDIDLLTKANDFLIFTAEENGSALPENRDPSSAPGIDRLIRERDCLVVNTLHQIIKNPAVPGFKIEPFDTVRGLFQEDEELYRGAGFRRKTHIQVAVRNIKCIKGCFLVPRPDSP